MPLDQIKSAIRTLTPQDRRKVVLYILELEKEHIGPQIAEDIDAVSKVVQDALQKLKNYVDKRT